MSSREDILGRVRRQLGRESAPADAGRDIDAWLAVRREGPRPTLDGELLSRFKEKSEALSTTVDVVAEWSAVPAAVARYLQNNGLPMQAVGWPLVSGHEWTAAGIAFQGRGAVDADLVGITGCYCAIAETGTLMLLSGPDTPASVSLLPETHVAVLAASRIVAGMEEAWNLARTELGVLPRAVNFVSGPSRTGDIEQTIVLGAHGPYRVHVVVVAGA
ncbi:MAG: lactate utilization protein C [Rhodocyclales bacterium]|nr:lactate utilization protein C [Rhodocyclales bacterium]MBI5784175.1 lactate utilization protein C [Rhodocyclales bacterium]